MRSPEQSTCGTDSCALRIPTTCPKRPSWYTSKGPSVCSPWEVTTDPVVFKAGIMYLPPPL
eukprot:7267927-Prorocentrum_lima.AAC.1